MKEVLAMRKNIDTSSIKPGKKAADWEYYCMVLDNCRRRHIPGYDPMNLSDEQQKKDWAMFEKYYENKTSSQAQ